MFRDPTPGKNPARFKDVVVRAVRLEKTGKSGQNRKEDDTSGGP
jgi:hypothetical protein